MDLLKLGPSSSIAKSKSAINEDFGTKYMDSNSSFRGSGSERVLPYHRATLEEYYSTSSLSLIVRGGPRARGHLQWAPFACYDGFRSPACRSGPRTPIPGRKAFSFVSRAAADMQAFGMLPSLEGARVAK
ncbi:hypothetical protein LshimejAT787_0409330 [Lyophyllum shimeji]|uniref:Uncharacterized protein n=1 Tax=Lyophyllum shimeji TaxID=47721 RepID=A0A9P3PKE2_LYOSH|nr:hypothetical protein LshimejAT787_0409330 [Lyophyllum shimeji]